MPPKHNESALLIGTILQEYKIESILGVGGFGITYLAQDTNLHKKVVIKEYFPSEITVRKESSTVVPKSHNDGDNFEWGLERFLLEAQTLAKFNHPNIVRISRFFRTNDTAYFVMDFEEGRDLEEYLQSRSGRLNEEEIYNIIMPILDGLREVHSVEYLHRDIKPANIFIRDNGSPLLIDFGASRFAMGQKSKSLSVVLTEGYAPKEQYSSTSKQGAYTDIYAIGAVMYKMATGKIPTESSARVDLTSDGELDPYKRLQDQQSLPYGDNFKIAVDWALEFRGKDRPQSVRELQDALLYSAQSPQQGASTVEPMRVYQERDQISQEEAQDNKPAKKGWSWLGFFFGPYYYAGYGKFGTGLVMGLMSLVPFMGIVIAIFAGFKSKRDLPIGKQNFKWLNVAILFAIVLAFAILMATIQR